MARKDKNRFRLISFVLLILSFVIVFSGCMTANLNEAAVKGKLSDAEKHLENGADINAANSSSATPLIDAVYHGNTKMVEFLLDHGANPDIANKYGVTPIIWSVEKGFFEITRLLLERGADVNSKTQKGLSPLISASYSGKYDLVKLFLEYKANPDIQNNHDLTPLHWAAEKGFFDIARILIDSGADLNIRNDLGWTPAYVAVKNKRTKIVELLLKHHADFGIPDKKGLNPLKLASQLKLGNHLVQLIETDVKERELSAQIAWDQAKQSGILESYDQFMLSYPYSKYYDEAKKTRDLLKEEHKARLVLERYNQAKPMAQEEIETFLQVVQDELSPFEIEKLLSKKNPHKRSILSAGDGVEIKNLSNERIENGETFSVFISTAVIEGQTTQILVSKKKGKISFRDFTKGKAGTKTIYIAEPVLSETVGLNDYRRVVIFSPGVWNGEYVNDGTGKWRKVEGK